MDFIVGIPKYSNKFFIIVVVYRLSICPHFCALEHRFTPTTVFQIVLNKISKLHGMPTSIVFDGNITFTSKFKKVLFKL